MAKKDKNAWKWRTFGGPLFSILVWKPPVSDAPDDRRYVHLVTWQDDNGPSVAAYSDSTDAREHFDLLNHKHGAFYACLDSVEVR